MTRWARGLAVLTWLLGLGFAAGGWASPASPATRAGPVRSVVVLGDSVASGEGTLYGYRYDDASRRWVGGDLDVSWPGPYPLCHDSPYAYGQAVAGHFAARLAQFACTGSTFSGGIVGPKLDGPAVARPPQFGNWATRSGLNAAYDRARPDLVLVTLGADDLRFTSVIEACVASRLEAAVVRTAPQCTATNPGTTFQRDYTAALPTVLRQEVTLLDWIEQRGRADGHRPKVVFTTYYDPFPTGGQRCPDTELLDRSQVRFLAAALARFDRALVRTITGQRREGVAVVDLQHAFDGHRWCSSRPWAYGLSIYQVTHPTSLLSQAPFHPTPEGQGRIAGLVEPAVDRLFGLASSTGGGS